MTSPPWPPMLPVRHVRIARPTDQLDVVARFYRDGLGLPEIGRFDAHAGYRGVLLGLPGTPYHLEFTQQDHGSPGQAPSRDNLLVLYLDNLAQAERVAGRLAALGYPRVEAENPYWTDNGAITVEDPDHWRTVLMPRPFADGPEPAVTVVVKAQVADVSRGRCHPACVGRARRLHRIGWLPARHPDRGHRAAGPGMARHPA